MHILICKHSPVSKFVFFNKPPFRLQEPVGKTESKKDEPPRNPEIDTIRESLDSGNTMKWQLINEIDQDLVGPKNIAEGAILANKILKREKAGTVFTKEFIDRGDKLPAVEPYDGMGRKFDVFLVSEEDRNGAVTMPIGRVEATENGSIKGKPLSKEAIAKNIVELVHKYKKQPKTTKEPKLFD